MWMRLVDNKNCVRATIYYGKLPSQDLTAFLELVRRYNIKIDFDEAKNTVVARGRAEPPTKSYIVATRLRMMRATSENTRLD